MRCSIRPSFISIYTLTHILMEIQFFKLSQLFCILCVYSTHCSLCIQLIIYLICCLKLKSVSNHKRYSKAQNQQTCKQTANCRNSIALVSIATRFTRSNFLPHTRISLANLPPNKLIIFSLRLACQAVLSIYCIFLIARYFQKGREPEEKKRRWKGRERGGSICYALHIDVMCIDI